MADPLLTLGDVDIGVRTVWMEARGEPYEGMKAVAHVLLNRVRWKDGDRWNTIAQVCLDWLQFSGWRQADPNFSAALSVNFGDATFRKCYRAFFEAMDEPDITNGARHYYAPHAVLDMPAWAKGLQPCATIGNHVFFNNVT